MLVNRLCLNVSNLEDLTFERSIYQKLCVNVGSVKHIMLENKICYEAVPMSIMVNLSKTIWSHRTFEPV